MRGRPSSAMIRLPSSIERATELRAELTPIEFIVRSGDRFRTVRIDYHNGLRYPHLERDPATPARLDDIIAARP